MCLGETVATFATLYDSVTENKALALYQSANISVSTFDIAPYTHVYLYRYINI